MSPHPGRWWHRLDDGRIQCDLCPRDCRLHDGQRGMCFVRQRIGDAMALTTAGCNLACKFCQNWDISKSREMDRLMDTASPEGIAEVARERRDERGLHLQRSRDLRRVRDGLRRRVPRARSAQRRGDRRLHAC